MTAATTPATADAFTERLSADAAAAAIAATEVVGRAIVSSHAPCIDPDRRQRSAAGGA